jgi:uncharacterized membrane protein
MALSHQMQLSNSDNRMQNAGRKAALLMTAAALNALEMFLPRLPFFPWLKPGLANSVTMVWIIRFGAMDALLFTLLRSWIVGFFFGFSFLTITLSLSGGILATAIMGVSWRLAGRRRLLGMIGLGVTGALFHNAGQIAAIYLLLAQNQALFYQLPPMFIASALFGSAIGMVTLWLLAVSESTGANPAAAARQAPDAMRISDRVSAGNKAAALIVAFISAGLLFVSHIPLLAIIAASITLAVQITVRGSIPALTYPLRGF